MQVLKHEVFKAYSDEEDYKKFDNLLDFVESKINKWLQENGRSAEDFISLETSYSNYEVRPVMCNPDTWYQRYTISVLVWYRV